MEKKQPTSQAQQETEMTVLSPTDNNKKKEKNQKASQKTNNAHYSTVPASSSYSLALINDDDEKEESTCDPIDSTVNLLTSPLFKACLSAATGAMIFTMNKGYFVSPPLSMAEKIYVPLVFSLLTVLSGENYCRWFIRAAKALCSKKKRVPLDMNALISLSILATIVYSTLITSSVIEDDLSPLGHYSGILFTITALNLSAMFKNIVTKSIDKSVGTEYEKLENLRPETARVLHLNNENNHYNVQKLSYEQVDKNAYTIVHPDEIVPIDGELLVPGHFNEQSLRTGESALSHYVKYNTVYAGFKYCGDMPTLIRTTVDGAGSYLDSLLRSVYENKNNSELSKKIETISRYFVPITVLSSVGASLLWTFTKDVNVGAYATISILLAACPCALGIANVLPISIARRSAIRKDVFIHNETYFEKSEFNLLVFDKTGTLTKLTFDTIYYLNNVNLATVGKYIFAMEKRRLEDNPNDSYASQIVKNINVSDMPPKIKTYQGQSNGMAVTFDDGNTLLTGNTEFLNQHHVDTTLFSTHVASSSKKKVYVVFNNKPCVIISFEETLRKEAKQAIKTLKSNYGLVMLTGDSRKNAQKIAKQLNIAYLAAQSPSQKRAYIKQLVDKDGKKVTMIGDGANDVEAANAANCGSIAVGKDALVRGMFDVTVSNLKPLEIIPEICLRTVNKQKQSLWISLAYNFSMILLTGFLLPWNDILIKPHWFGVGMALSSLAVMLWSYKLVFELDTLFARHQDHLTEPPAITEDNNTSVTVTLDNQVNSLNEQNEHEEEKEDRADQQTRLINEDKALPPLTASQLTMIKAEPDDLDSKVDNEPVSLVEEINNDENKPLNEKKPLKSAFKFNVKIECEGCIPLIKGAMSDLQTDKQLGSFKYTGQKTSPHNYQISFTCLNTHTIAASKEMIEDNFGDVGLDVTFINAAPVKNETASQHKDEKALRLFKLYTENYNASQATHQAIKAADLESNNMGYENLIGNQQEPTLKIELNLNNNNTKS